MFVDNETSKSFSIAANIYENLTDYPLYRVSGADSTLNAFNP